MAEPDLNQKTWLSTQEAARYLGLTEIYLRKLRVAGTGPRYTKLTKIIRYKRGDIDAWMDAQSTTSTSKAA